VAAELADIVVARPVDVVALVVVGSNDDEGTPPVELTVNVEVDVTAELVDIVVARPVDVVALVVVGNDDGTAPVELTEK